MKPPEDELEEGERTDVVAAGVVTFSDGKTDALVVLPFIGVEFLLGRLRCECDWDG